MFDKDRKELNQKETQEEYVSTNIGKIPLADYREIIALQYGFSSYEEMKSEGITIG